jgi:hypothetical protein
LNLKRPARFLPTRPRAFERSGPTQYGHAAGRFKSSNLMGMRASKAPMQWF